MIRRRGVPALMLATLLAAGCAGSDRAAPGSTDDPAEVDTTAVDLADGAFERNDASRTDGADDADDADIDDDATTSTVASADDGASSTSVESTDGADVGDDTDLDDGSTDGSTATSGGTGSSGTDSGTGGDTTSTIVAPAVQPGEGVIVVGGATYRFPATTCEIDGTYVVVEGEGTSSFSRYQASIYYERDDLDDDGQEDLALDVVLDFEPPASGDRDEVPELYAGKVDSQTFVSGADITVTVEGQRIHGGGLMTDFNGVVFPVDQPGPMAFDVRCAEL